MSLWNLSGWNNGVHCDKKNYYTCSHRRELWNNEIFFIESIQTWWYVCKNLNLRIKSCCNPTLRHLYTYDLSFSHYLAGTLETHYFYVFKDIKPFKISFLPVCLYFFCKEFFFCEKDSQTSWNDEAEMNIKNI